MSDARSFEQQTADAVRQLYILVGIVAVAVLGAIGIAVWGLVRITSNEHQVCKIQARGLSATPFLVNSLDEIHSLLTFPPTPAAQRQRETVPPKQLADELMLIGSLDRNLAQYVLIERQQPKSRDCS